MSGSTDKRGVRDGRYVHMARMIDDILYIRYHHNRRRQLTIFVCMRKALITIWCPFLTPSYATKERHDNVPSYRRPSRKSLCFSAYFIAVLTQQQRGN